MPTPPQLIDLAPRFERLGVAMRVADLHDGCEAVFNPACARLRDGSLQLYPRIVAPGNVSRIGSFAVRERPDGSLAFDDCGYALEPEAPYEFRDEPGGYGCEDPRVTFVAALDLYVMAYVAFGPRAPEVALAVSRDGTTWERLGLVRFQESEAPFSDKDAAFFPEPVESPSGVPSLAFYHRPTLHASVTSPNSTASLAGVGHEREQIAIAYVSLERALADVRELCTVGETHRLQLGLADAHLWARTKVGAGTPPVRLRDGWLSVFHGVDPLEDSGDRIAFRYAAGIVVHDARRLDKILYCSRAPVLLPQAPEELSGPVGHVVFPTGIDPRPQTGGRRAFDVYYGMADCAVGRGRLWLDP